jgi:cell division protein FtsQ
MKIFARFTSELDGSGEKISQELSEVDLSDPEDVKALIPDHSTEKLATEILVHFGDQDFLDRYKKFKEHLAEWRTVYPKLSSVDMRYERQVVLEMPPGSAAATAAGNAAPVASTDSHAADKTASAGTTHEDTPAVKASTVPIVVVKHPATKPAAKAPEHVVAQSERAFDVPSKKSAPKVKKPVAAVKHSSSSGKTSTSHTTAAGTPASATQSHTTQAVHP